MCKDFGKLRRKIRQFFEEDETVASLRSFIDRRILFKLLVEEWLDSEIEWWIKSLERFDNFLKDMKLVSNLLFVAEIWMMD